MMPSEESSVSVEIYDLLYRLGASATSTIFFHTAYAVHVAMEQPQTLLLVTKWLYPEVARHYHTTWGAVERSIRRLITTVWNGNYPLLCELAGHPLASRPVPAEFLKMLATYLSSGAAA